MMFLNEAIQKQIREFIGVIERKVTIVLFTKEEPCDLCEETKQLIYEVKALNDKIEIVEKDFIKDVDDVTKYHIEMVPSFVLLDHEGTYKGVKFNGIPAGHEINAFLTALIEMSGVDFKLDPYFIERIAKINKPVNIKVFVTLTCSHCSGAVQKAHRLAMSSKFVEAEMIEAQTFYDLSEKYQVTGVPKIVFNDKFDIVGNQPMDAFLDQIDKL